jgi:hypothetical protein
MRDDLFDRTTNSLHSIERDLMSKVLLNDRTHQQHLGCHVGYLHKCHCYVECLHEKELLSVHYENDLSRSGQESLFCGQMQIYGSPIYQPATPSS